MNNYTKGPGPLDGSKQFRKEKKMTMKEMPSAVQLQWTGTHAIPKEKRTAVIEEVTSYVVKMYEEDGNLVHIRDCHGHSKRYAEDCAENWETRVIKE